MPKQSFLEVLLMKLTVDYNKIVGKIKPMNAVNNGPHYTENGDQNLTNLYSFKDANIPYARIHDASICYDYGGEHTVDVLNIFPNFDADPNLPESYDFTLTDMYLKNIELAGSRVFYRLGNKIEHWPKHYGILPPKDYEKWAVVCEHIIRHFNEGWADGLHMDIEYWEIWNEPDLEGKCWLGTPEQFYDLFAVTAKHLKKCFPNIKIGGPAVTHCNENWLVPFFEKLKSENVPLDFYSWHRYAKDVSEITNDVRLHREILDRFGFTDTESILNEWNYVCGWGGEGWRKSILTINSFKGAAFIAAVMAACQREKLDMLMYYDARINGSMNNMFAHGTLEPLKNYYPIKAWGEMLKMGNECETVCDIPDIYAVSAVKDGEGQTMVAYYTDDDEALPMRFTVEMSDDKLKTIYLLDAERDMEPFEKVVPDGGKFQLAMKPNTVVVIK